MDGFYQVRLDKESSLLATFWTPFGRFLYLWVPKGISSAPEEYQRRQNEALAGLNGVEVIADNILCYGSGETMNDVLKDYDSNLLNLLDPALSMNLTLNKKKLSMRLHQVTYMGHSFTSHESGDHCKHASTQRQESSSAPPGMYQPSFQIYANYFRTCLNYYAN